MDNLEELWGTFNLTEAEDVVIEISKEDVEDVCKKGKLCLVGKVWTDRMINRSLIESAMNKIWRMSVKPTFKKVGNNTFLISFALAADKSLVEGGRLWLFDSSLFVIEPYNGKTKPKDLSFDEASFCL